LAFAVIAVIVTQLFLRVLPTDPAAKPEGSAPILLASADPGLAE
jgi:hypothetical protein